MIALEPEFLGRFAAQSKLTEGIDPDALPFARQPRLNRLRIQGKADETEDVNEGGSVAERSEDRNMKRDPVRRERERSKMRGKGKSIKRCVGNCSLWPYGLTLVWTRYLRKQRKNVIDPKAVSCIRLGEL
jgi:U3 small nucleolar RNA-associated protein 7